MSQWVSYGRMPANLNNILTTRPWTTLGRVGPLLIGALFIYAGVYKAFYPAEATLAVAVLGFSVATARLIVILVTIMEVYLGVLLVWRIDLRYGLTSATALLLLFSLFLFYLARMAHPPRCGCLGLTGAFAEGRQGAVFGLVRNCIMLWVLKASHQLYFPQRVASTAPAT